MSEANEPSADRSASTEAQDAGEERFPELAEIEDEIQRRIRSNQRFLERFMDDDFDADDEDENAAVDEAGMDGADVEEL